MDLPYVLAIAAITYIAMLLIEHEDKWKPVVATRKRKRRR